MRRFAFFFACSPRPRLKDIYASFSMLEGRCNRPSRHCSLHRPCRKITSLSHLHLLPTPVQCSPPLQASSARSFNRRPSSLSPKLCHPLHSFPLKLHNSSLSRSPYVSRRCCTCWPRELPTRRLPTDWWSLSRQSRNMSAASC